MRAYVRSRSLRVVCVGVRFADCVRCTVCACLKYGVCMYHVVVPPQSPDAVKARFGNMLVEDTRRGGKSYVDFLCTVHTQIQTKLLE